MAALRSKIRSYQKKQKTSTQRELREPWLIDGDLAEQADALAARREQVVAEYALERKALVGGSGWDGEADDRMAGPDTSGIDAAEQAALAELDAEVAELRAQAEEQTVFLIFRPVSSPRYDEIWQQAVTEAAKPGAARSAEALLTSLLAAACFRGTEVDGKVDDSESWDELKALTDDEDDFGVPMMTPGFVDFVETKVLALNRRIPASPF